MNHTTRWKVLPARYEGDKYSKVVPDDHNNPLYILVTEQATAEQIVREHNAHAALVEAATKVLEQFDKATMFDANGSVFDELRAALRLAHEKGG